jgi:dTDP-4-amino-4,6-dideoxygalactose transaminase
MPLLKRGGRLDLFKAAYNHVVCKYNDGRPLTFEQAFASYIGVPYAVAVNSCTAALHLALEAIGLAKGDDMLVPTMTFAATTEVVMYSKLV